MAIRSNDENQNKKINELVFLVEQVRDKVKIDVEEKQRKNVNGDER